MRYRLKGILFLGFIVFSLHIAKSQDIETDSIVDESLQDSDTIPSPSSFIFGDINKDGEVTADDFSLLVARILKADTTTLSFDKRADINEDGVVSISDLAYIVDLHKTKNEILQNEEQLSPGINLCYNLENRLVTGYLDLADKMYDEGIGRSGTSAFNYNILGQDSSYFLSNLVGYPDDTASWEEQPAPVAFSVPFGTSQVAVSTTPFFTNNLTYACLNDSVIIYNLIPNRLYWYRCYSQDEDLLTQGLFKTKGRVRMLACPNVRNVRDVGGWPCSGGHLAYGKLLRSGTLEFVHPNDENEQILRNEIGLSYEMDLRHENEAKGSTPDLAAPMAYGNYPLFAYMWLMNGTYWSESRQKVAASSCRQNFGNALKKFVENLESGLCTDAHCAGGADRTGMFCFVVGALCGVSEADLIKDWELTSFTYYYKWIDKEDLAYYVMSDNKYVNQHAELRSVCQYLYDYHGGKTGASLRKQVESWLKSFMPDLAPYFSRLRNQMIVPDEKNPMIVKDVSSLLDGQKYTITGDDTMVFPSQKYKYIDEMGTVSNSSSCAVTDYIDCIGYSHLLVNCESYVVGAYYDADYNYLGSILDDSVINERHSIFEYKDYLIPESACYVRFNLMKDSDITAVLSDRSYLSAD